MLERDVMTCIILSRFVRWIKFDISDILIVKKSYPDKRLYLLTYFNLPIYNLLNTLKKNIYDTIFN